MNNDKARIFVDKLIDKTNRGSVAWERTSEEGVYQSILGTYVVRFSFEQSPAALYRITLYNIDGEALDSYTDETFEPRGAAIEPDSLFSGMAEAHLAAKRSALGINHALDQMIDDLDSY